MLKPAALVIGEGDVTVSDAVSVRVGECINSKKHSSIYSGTHSIYTHMYM